MSIRLAVCHRPSTRLPTPLGLLGTVGQHGSHVAAAERARSWGVTQQGRRCAGVLPFGQSRAGGDDAVAHPSGSQSSY